MAEVHGTALQHTARPGIDTHIDPNLEPGVATGVDNISDGTGGGLILSGHLALLQQWRRNLARRIPGATTSGPAETKGSLGSHAGIEPKTTPTFWQPCRQAGRSGR
ncbi:MAG: hypothetical protein ABSD89_13005 [Halobacteriota archaeon]